jgi:hypothetical protein
MDPDDWARLLILLQSLLMSLDLLLRARGLS